MPQNGRPSKAAQPRRGIAGQLRDAHIEWNQSHCYFVPDDRLEKIMTYSKISEELKYMQMDTANIAHCARRICPSTKRLFAAIFYSRRGGQCEDVDNLLAENISDDDLPLVRVHPKDDEDRRHWHLARQNHSQCKQDDHSSCYIKTISKWDREFIDDIERVQWFFKAPVFVFNLEDVQHYEFHKSTVMPFTKDEENDSIRRGGYGEVWKIEIHPAHQKLLPLPNFRVRMNEVQTNTGQCLTVIETSSSRGQEARSTQPQARSREFSTRIHDAQPSQFARTASLGQAPRELRTPRTLPLIVLLLSRQSPHLLGLY